jgi:1-deoxy-D-xylulose-5-phosphate reductoisomerase
MQREKLVILGSTGSIGTQTLDIVKAHPDRFELKLLTAHGNWKLLAEQILAFSPEYAVIADVSCFEKLKEAVAESKTQLFAGHEHIITVQKEIGRAVTLNALVGYSGFLPSFTALEFGSRLCLANKESLVVGGEIIRHQLHKGGEILPVDSEHSAIFQCLSGERFEDVAELILTASGGPFRMLPIADMAQITVEQALRHPNWSMGSKITIDSATLMNKGLEIIEAFWLFGLPLHQISAVIHPQSLIHSMVRFVDGSIKAQLGLPDMHLPILYALSYPERWDYAAKPMPWHSLVTMTFEPIDETRFPCFRLAREALQQGGYAPAVLNAANEIAVERFLKREIGYIHIPRVVEDCLEQCAFTGALHPAGLEAADAETRRAAKALRY